MGSSANLLATFFTTAIPSTSNLRFHLVHHLRHHFSTAAISFTTNTSVSISPTAGCMPTNSASTSTAIPFPLLALHSPPPPPFLFFHHYVRHFPTNITTTTISPSSTTTTTLLTAQ
ncbi:unnamed protein product [Polarella glacialis]|uniref:Uncharacterized protein n=1 Tax=Polarella glacialis TaxID=89957 RepID=A0A813KMA0_POLGL|nr:unnamed protein product [Polarella glacialis]